MGVSRREGSKKRVGKARLSNSTWYTKHEVDAEDEKYILGVWEDSDYGQWFVCVLVFRGFVGMFERGVYGIALVKKCRY